MLIQKRGFTLIELMIALAVSSLLFLALIAVFVANISHYQKSINVNRLNSQLEAIVDLMANDIRRAGYWSNASNDIGTDQNNNPFMASGADITISGSCILFSYDHDSNGSLASVSSSVDDERYGFRLNGNAIQARPPGASFSCAAASNAWETITDTNIISITALSFTLNTTPLTTGPGSRGVTLRSVDISITGQLVSDATITNTLTAHVRVRNDKFIP